MSTRNINTYLTHLLEHSRSIATFYDQVDWKILQRFDDEMNIETVRELVDCYIDQKFFAHIDEENTLSSLQLILEWKAVARDLDSDAKLVFDNMNLEELVPLPTPDMQKSAACNQSDPIRTCSAPQDEYRLFLNLIKGAASVRTDDCILKKQIDPIITTLNVTVNSQGSDKESPPNLWNVIKSPSNVPGNSKGSHMVLSDTSSRAKISSRRCSSVDKKLPAYIRRQLDVSRPQQADLQETQADPEQSIILNAISESIHDCPGTKHLQNFVINPESMRRFDDESIAQTLSSPGLHNLRQIESDPSNSTSGPSRELNSTYSFRSGDSLGDSLGGPSNSGYTRF